MRRRRVLVILAVLLLGHVAVFVRLVRLQIGERDMWMRESQRTTMRFESLPFERGWIFDRHGEPLALAETVRDLVFRYRDWRRETVAGQVSHAWWTLGEPRFRVVSSLASVDGLARALGRVTVGEVAALGPRQRRIDLLFYLERAFGASVEQALEARLRDESRDPRELLAELPGFEVGLAAAVARAAREEQALGALAELLGLDRDDLVARMDRALALADERVQRKLARRSPGERDYKLFQQLHVQFDDDPARVATRVPYDAQTLVAIRGTELGGFEVQLDRRRVYPPAVADVAPLIVGRVGSPRQDDIALAEAHRTRLADLASQTSLDAEELEEYEWLRVQVREVDYAYGDERGILGVEAALEEVLRGKRGWRASSRSVDEVFAERAEPQRGGNVTLTLDVELQQACEEVLDDAFDRPPAVDDVDGDVPTHWTGAIVLVDAPTGEILALATGPRPTRRELTTAYGSLLQDDPWLRIKQRGVDAGWSRDLPPPGSTFKPVSALAGLAAGVITPHTTFFCDGGLDVGDRRMGCLGHHGDTNLERALAKSCNVYFYELGRRLGALPLRVMAARVGFGEDLRLLRHNATLETVGVPVGSGFQEARPALGAPPDTVSDAMRLAIGQAPLDDVTPLQVACMMAAVGTGSYRPPSLIKSIEGYPDLPRRPAQNLEVRGSHMARVRDGLATVVESGTASVLEDVLEEELPWLAGQIAGKTGTAECNARADHSWFAGYLPRREPRLAFAVLVEHVGLHGNEAALPVFKRLLDKPAVQAYLHADVLGLGGEEPWR